MKNMSIFLLALISASAFAQTPCDPQDSKCKIEGILSFYLKQQQMAVAEKANKDVEKEVVNTNKPASEPAPFAHRVHNTYEDYLNLFNFAINKVEESDNGQSLLVRFNPLRQGSSLLGLTLTVSQGVLSDDVKALIPEDRRDAVAAELNKQISDTDDLTWAASYSPATDFCDPASTGRCWGRSPSAYRALLSRVLINAMPEPQVSISDAVEMLKNDFTLKPGENLLELPLSRSNNPDRTLETLKQLATRVQQSIASTKEIAKNHHFDLLPKLIENQPQVSLTGTYHTTNRYSGPGGYGVATELHFANENINTLRSRCRQNLDKARCFQQQIDTFAADESEPVKFVLTASWNHTKTYFLDALTGIDPPISFEPLNLSPTNTLQIKAQGGRQMATEVRGKPTRVDGSLEFIYSDKSSLRTQNRGIARVTFSVPFGDQITVPVTVTYATKPEFLGDTKNRIGAHIGLSYRIPSLFGAKE